MQTGLSAWDDAAFMPLGPRVVMLSLWMNTLQNRPRDLHIVFPWPVLQQLFSLIQQGFDAADATFSC